ncbi:hypothetical protein B0H15DRAFT_930833 [Mycena belliarum]|uniref:Uncharacterized protein n=1 Tax=Mycena belliarum TaxID=1033014 RepID=A0AAD6U858_9AGAR|nr:hypothetical protein B0H15DRAFT_930833 [Mycena belliae]
MTSTTPNSQQPKPSGGIGMKIKGGVQVAKGLGDTVRGSTMGATDSVEHRDSSVNDEIARRGRVEIEEGIAMIKGRAPNPTASAGAPGAQHGTAQLAHTGPGNSLQGQGWGTGINGGNADATTHTTGFPPPKGAEYAQNSTTANANARTDLGHGPNAHTGAGADSQLPQYPTNTGTGINGGNAGAITHNTGFPPPSGAEYAQNSTTGNAHGQGPNAHGGADSQLPGYPAPGGPPPQDFKGGMANSNPTQMGNRDAMTGGEGAPQRHDADPAMR